MRAARSRSRVRWPSGGRCRPRARHVPPLHATMSRSSTRGPQRLPRRRPNSRSSAFSCVSMSGGPRSLSIRATALAKSRPAPPCAGLSRIGEASNRPNCSSSSRDRRFDHLRRAARSGRAGGWSRWRWRRGALRLDTAARLGQARCSSPAPPTCRRSRRPRRRATARCARGWSRSAHECRAEHPDWWNAPVPAFGDPDAWLAIVGLAPGKHGANRTGRPFTGDYAGELLYATLLKFGLAEGEYRADPADGLRLKGAVILNAVKCLPPAEQADAGRRSRRAATISRPRSQRLPNARVLVALGQIAHVAAARALRPAGPRPRSSAIGAEASAPDGRHPDR